MVVPGWGSRRCGGVRHWGPGADRVEVHHMSRGRPVHAKEEGIVADDVFEVFVLLDHACDLAMNDGTSGEALLGLLTCQTFASDLAVRARPRQVGLPVSVAECVARADALASRWDLARERGNAVSLVALLSQLRVELTGAP